jgi:hypothetical protein
MSFTQQQLFDKAYLGVMKQGMPTWGKNRYNDPEIMCVYTDDAGNHCGIGHCMTPEQQESINNTAFNARGIRLLINNVPEMREYFGNENIEFVSDLQKAHDNAAGECPSINLDEGDTMETINSQFIELFDIGMREFATLHLLTVPHFEKSAS